MDANPAGGDPGPGQGAPPQVDTAGIAANIQKAYAASKAKGVPISDADLEAFARRESDGVLGLQQVADWHAAQPVTGAGAFGAPSSPLQAHAQNVGHGILGLPASLAAIPGAIRALGAAGGMNLMPQEVSDLGEAARKPLQAFADKNAPLTTDAQMGLANHPIIAKLARFLEDNGGNALASSVVGSIASAAKAVPMARVAAAIDQAGGVPQMRDNLASFVSAGHGGNASLAAMADPTRDLAQAAATQSSKAHAALADLAQAGKPYDPAARLAALGPKPSATWNDVFTPANVGKLLPYVTSGGAGALAHSPVAAVGGPLVAGARQLLERHVATATNEMLTRQGATAVGKLLDDIEAFHAQSAAARGLAPGAAAGSGAGLMNYTAHTSLGDGGQYNPGTANRRSGPAGGNSDPSWGGAP